MCKGNLQKKVWKKVMIERARGELLQSKMTRNMTSRKNIRCNCVLTVTNKQRVIIICIMATNEMGDFCLAFRSVAVTDGFKDKL